MKHTLSFSSFARIISRIRLEAWHELLDDDKTIWTVSEVMEELSKLPPDSPVVIATEDGEQEDMLFWFDRCEDDEGNKALFIRVDLREVSEEDELSNAGVTGAEKAQLLERPS